MMGESYHCVKSPELKEFGLNSVVANPCVKMMFDAPWVNLAQFEPDESRYYRLNMCLCHRGSKKNKKSTDGKTGSLSVFVYCSQLTFFGYMMLLNRDLTN